MPTPGELTAIRSFFETGTTRSYDFRRKQLVRLKEAVMKYEHEIYASMHADLKKSPEECWATENGFLIAEINAAITNLRHWMEPERARSTLINFPSSSYVISEPLGVVLIIGPWNYPINLLLTPLVGAIAAGNCVVLKSSEFAPATSGTMKKIIQRAFDNDYIIFIEGDGSIIVPAMMNSFHFDHVFFTGSTAVGKRVYELAARDLIPVTLELGGKSPCVVEEDANIKVAARRIAITKFSNAGQMCAAPDYVLVHESKKDALVVEVKKALRQFFGEDPANSNYYGKVINDKQFERLATYLSQGKIIHGGSVDKARLYIEPTILDEVSMDHRVMQEEIFGPVLPLLTFSTMEEALKIIKKNKDPLAFYLFTSSRKKEKKWVGSVSFGGGCINNASYHLTNHYLPFGGRGNSGIGKYHGRYSFETFSHQKAIMRTATWFDPSMKYPPFEGKMKFFKLIIR